MTSRRIAAAALLFALLSLPAFSQLAQRTISTSGSATIRTVPDEIFIGVAVESFDPSLDVATRGNDSAIRAVVAAMKSLGVPEQQIRTEAISVDIAYRDSGHPAKGIEGYFARKTITVKVTDSATAEKAVVAALRAGANRILGIQYNTTQMRKLRDQARVEAAKAASEKAQLLASQFGAKLGRVLSINEGYSVLYGSARWNPYGYGYGMQMAQQNVSMSNDSGGSGDGSDVIPTGEMGVRAEVSVAFELVP